MPSLDINTILALASALLFVGLIALFAFLVRHQEQVEPEEPEVYGVELLQQHYGPGETVEQPTPYFVAPIPASPDPLEISANLDKKIVLSGAMLFGIFALIGGYFVIQGEASPLGPGGLRGEAAKHQLRQDINYGKRIYANLCYDCHGRDGKAGTTPAGDKLPGLPLNVSGNKYETLQNDPASLQTRRKLIETTIERGRPKPPPNYSMPSWGRTEGGQLSAWQIKQLADLIMYGTDEDWAEIVEIRREVNPEHDIAERIPAPPAQGSGKDVAQNVCTACHAIETGRTSTIPQAPNLADWIAAGSKPRPENAPLTELSKSDPDWLVKWVSNPRKIKPDTIMTPQAAAEGGTLDDNQLQLVIKWLRGEEK